ncbi:MFS transporter [Pseudohaliea sp.]|uniref:MFS transporter n=1 Tax=Pseudohaliea sp. TaxID=2740289 RepID=UPI0032EA90AD
MPADAEAQPAPTLGGRELAILLFALIATAIGQSLVFAVLAPLGREVGLSELQITSIIAVSALVFALGSPRWGRFSDRAGRKPVIITGLVGYTVGTVLFTSVFWAGLAGLLGGTVLYTVALVARCGQSMIMSATTPACTAYAADHTTPAARTRAMARLGTANSIGMILGPAMGGAFAALGLLAPLYFAGALTAVAAVVVWRGLPRIPVDERRSHRRARLRFTDPRVRLYIFTAVALFTGFSAIQQTLGFLLQDALGLSSIGTAQYTGAAMMISAVFAFAIQVTVMQRLKLAPGSFMRLGLLATLAGAACIGSAQGFGLIAAGMGCLGAGLGLTMPAVTAGASIAVGAEEQGGAAGLVGACPAIGFVSGPLIGGALYQVAPALAPLFSATVIFLTLVVLVLADR